MEGPPEAPLAEPFLEELEGTEQIQGPKGRSDCQLRGLQPPQAGPP